jgi:hypothetical protein
VISTCSWFKPTESNVIVALWSGSTLTRISGPDRPSTKLRRKETTPEADTSWKMLSDTPPRGADVPARSAKASTRSRRSRNGRERSRTDPASPLPLSTIFSPAGYSRMLVSPVAVA